MTEPLLLLSGRTQYADPTPADQAVIPLSLNNEGRLRVASKPTAASALTYVTTATTNANSVKASAGQLFELSVSNLTAGTIYVKLYNKASAPTVGTDIPILTIPVTAGSVWLGQFGPVGKRFSTGIALAVTGAAAATDTTAVAVGAQIHGSYV